MGLDMGWIWLGFRLGWGGMGRGPWFIKYPDPDSPKIIDK